MTEQATKPTESSEGWARMWPLVVILVVTIGAWFLLSHLALHAREKDLAQIARGPITTDYGTAKTWATDLLGLAATFAGFLGVAAAAKKNLGLTSRQRAQSAEGGMAGILAGATLLGVGGWSASLGLAAMATGVVAVRVVRTLRGAE
jgi:hypothetical protein